MEYDETPIRGMAGRQLTLDELIEAGERQMGAMNKGKGPRLHATLPRSSPSKLGRPLSSSIRTARQPMLEAPHGAAADGDEGASVNDATDIADLSMGIAPAAELEDADAEAAYEFELLERQLQETEDFDDAPGRPQATNGIGFTDEEAANDGGRAVTADANARWDALWRDEEETTSLPPPPPPPPPPVQEENDNWNVLSEQPRANGAAERLNPSNYGGPKNAEFFDAPANNQEDGADEDELMSASWASNRAPNFPQNARNSAEVQLLDNRNGGFGGFGGSGNVLEAAAAAAPEQMEMALGLDESAYDDAQEWTSAETLEALETLQPLQNRRATGLDFVAANNGNGRAGSKGGSGAAVSWQSNKNNVQQQQQQQRRRLTSGATSSSRADEDLTAIPQSKLVRQVFGGGGGGGGGASGGAARGGPINNRRGSTGGGGRGGSAVEAALAAKLAELEAEIGKYRIENEKTKKLRKQHETVFQEVMRKRQEVRQWADAERAAVDAWCNEQRETAARERRAALKAAANARQRAAAAPDRRDKAEAEALRATVEQQRVEAEAARKKARAVERRLQQQLKDQATRIVELEAQVSFLERQRVDMWAASDASNGPIPHRTFAASTSNTNNNTNNNGTLAAAAVVKAAATAGAAGAAATITPSSVRTRNLAAGRAGNGASGSSVPGSGGGSGGSSHARRGRSAPGAAPRSSSLEGIAGGGGSSARKPTASQLQQQQRFGSLANTPKRPGLAAAGPGDERAMASRAAQRARGTALHSGRATSDFAVEGGSMYPGAVNSDFVAEAAASDDLDAPGNEGYEDDAWGEEGEPEQALAGNGGGGGVGGPDAGWQQGGSSSAGEEEEGGEIEEEQQDDDEGGKESRYDDMPVESNGMRGEALEGGAGGASKSNFGAREEGHFGGALGPAAGAISESDWEQREDHWSMQLLRRQQLDQLEPEERGSAGRVTRSGEDDAWGASSTAGPHHTREIPEDAEERYEDVVREAEGYTASGGLSASASAAYNPLRYQRLPLHVQRANALMNVAVKPGYSGGLNSRSTRGNAVPDAADEGLHDASLAADYNGGSAVAVNHSSASHFAANSFNVAAAASAVGSGPFDHRSVTQPLAAGAAAEPASSGGGGSGAGGGASGKVEQYLPDGRRIVTFRNGTRKEVLPNGSAIVRFANGDTKRTDASSGVVVYRYATAGTAHTTYPNGLEVFEFASGQVERHHPGGSKEIRFPDGTQKTIRGDGVEESLFVDGVRVVDYPDGRQEAFAPDGTASGSVGANLVGAGAGGGFVESLAGAAAAAVGWR